MASILDKAKFTDSASRQIRQTVNEIRSNQYVHDYYHITKGLLPKGFTDGVEITGDTLTDIVTGVAINTPWRRKIARDRAAHALEFEQLNPVAEAASNTVQSIKNGVTKVKEILGGNVSNAVGTKGNRSERLTKVINLNTQNKSPYTPEGRGPGILNMTNNPEAPSSDKQIIGLSSRRRLWYDSNIHAGIYIVNRISISPYQVIELQNRPSSLSIKPETSWAVIKSMGRNNPMYHYTGAEDTISFNISWYCNNKDNYQEVLAKCRLLESWSKADGYTKGPPVLELIFGDNSDTLFEGHYFILWSAPYDLNNLSMQHPRYYEGNTLNIYPQTATQELTFKRVTDHNLTTNEIIPPKLLRNSGVMGPYDKLANNIVNQRL